MNTCIFGSKLPAVLPPAIAPAVVKGVAGGKEGSSLQSRWNLFGGRPLTVPRGEILVVNVRDV